MYNAPLAFFLTFRTYGTWLHGDERGSVDRRNNGFGTCTLPHKPGRVRFEHNEMKQPPMELGDAARDLVGVAIRDVCNKRGWKLLASNVRTNHVHIVVAANATPERIMNTVKVYATRALREAGLAEPDTRVWSRHGSTIYLFTIEKLAEKVDYVLNRQ